MASFALLALACGGAAALFVGGGQPTAAEARLETNEGGRHVRGEILVKFARGTSETQIEQLNATHGTMVVDSIRQLGVLRLRVTGGKREEQVIAAYRRNPIVQYAEPNYIAVVADTTPDDPIYASDQWGPQKIQAPAAWDITTGSSSVVVAVIDTGISASHPDLDGKVVAGYDFVNDDSDPDDDMGHGTHVAGIVGASTNNSVGVAGISWGTRLMSIKACNSNGNCASADIAAAVVYAADHGANIINMSLGGTSYSQTLQDAISYAHARNALVVAAAGNSAQTGNPVIYPAAMEYVVAVGATTEADDIAFFSSHGLYVDIAAPGLHIYSTTPSGYSSLSGTSMAAPHVAGLAALVLSVAPSLTADQLESVIVSTANDLGDPGRDEYFGWGRINVFGAVRAASALLTGTSTPAPTPVPPTATPVPPTPTPVPPTPTPVLPTPTSTEVAPNATETPCRGNENSRHCRPGTSESTATPTPGDSGATPTSCQGSPNSRHCRSASAFSGSTGSTRSLGEVWSTSALIFERMIASLF